MLPCDDGYDPQPDPKLAAAGFTPGAADKTCMCCGKHYMGAPISHNCAPCAELKLAHNRP